MLRCVPLLRKYATVAVVGLALGFSSVRYSLKLGPVYPSAKYHVLLRLAEATVTGTLSGELLALGSVNTREVVYVWGVVLGVLKVKVSCCMVPAVRDPEVGLTLTQEAAGWNADDQFRVPVPEFANVIVCWLGLDPGAVARLTAIGLTWNVALPETIFATKASCELCNCE